MNNTVYHAIFDSMINIFLIRHCGLSINKSNSSVVGFMVKNLVLFNSFVLLPNYLDHFDRSMTFKRCCAYIS